MNAIIMSEQQLPALIDRAARMLSEARTSGEVLEARDHARVAYDAAKAAGRMARSKRAHDEVVAAVYRAQADALLIEARAKSRLADEYDAAQERGEVAGHGGGRNFKVGNDDVEPTAADLGLRRDEIHEARQVRDAERAQPDFAKSTLDREIEAGREPTRAALRRSVIAAVEDARRPQKQKNPFHHPDAMTDRVYKFSGLCRSLAEFHDVEAIAEWSLIPQTAGQLPQEVRAAMLILSRFMESQNA